MDTRIYIFNFVSSMLSKCVSSTSSLSHLCYRNVCLKFFPGARLGVLHMGVCKWSPSNQSSATPHCGFKSQEKSEISQDRWPGCALCEHRVAMTIPQQNLRARSFRGFSCCQAFFANQPFTKRTLGDGKAENRPVTLAKVDI